MQFIKHSNQRINLENITSYKSKGKREILFETTGTDTNKYIIWKFNSRESRNSVLEELDAHTGLKDFTPEDHTKEGAEIDENFI